MALTLWLLHDQLGASPNDFLPISAPEHLNDQTSYFLQINAMWRAGWSGGYHGVNELTPAARFSHFGPHGPPFPTLYGGLGRLFGWDAALGIWIHLALVTAASLFYMGWVRPKGVEFLLTGLVLATAWGVYQYLPTLMQEGLHTAFAILLAALFQPLVAGKPVSKYYPMWLLGVIILAGFFRYSWAFLAVPCLLLAGGRQRWLPALLAGGGIVLAAYAWVGYWSAPYPYYHRFYPSSFLATLRQSSADAIQLLIEKSELNGQFFSRVPWWSDLDPTLILYYLQQYQFLLLLLALPWLLWRYHQRGEVVFHLANSGTVWLIAWGFLLLGTHSTYRGLITPLLLSLLVLGQQKRYGIVVLLLSCNLLSFPAFLGVFRANVGPSYNQANRAESAVEGLLAANLAYQPQANPWCNTVLVPIEGAIPRSVPRGMGLMFTVDPRDLEFPLHSGYFLVDSALYLHLAGRVSLAPLRGISQPPLVLARNGESGCWGEIGQRDEGLAQAQAAFDLLPPNATLFYPGQTLSFEFTQVTDDQLLAQPAYYDLITLLARAQLEADLSLTPDETAHLDDWRVSKVAQPLATLGIEYLLIDSPWSQYLSQAEYSTLMESGDYQVVAQWRLPNQTEYWLLRLVSDES
jgi:hypothetical protein